MEMEQELKSNPSSPPPLTANPFTSQQQQQTQTLPTTGSNQCAAAPAPVAAPTNVTTLVPVPIVHNDGTYAYITVKGSLHDRSCSIFGLIDTEIQAISKRFTTGVKPVVNGVMVACPPMLMLNTLAELSYKVVCSCGEAEICWTMQREI